jgi:glyoxylate reductase
MTTRILSTSPLVGSALHELGKRLPDLCIAPYRSVAWRMELAKAEALVVLLSEPIREADLELAPNVKVIGTYSVGTNHLPQQLCQERGIRIVNTPGVLTEATADLALTLLLAVTRRVAEGEALVRSGTWKGWAPDQLLGVSLHGKICGILGSGAIGKAFARRVWALGMKPAFWDREGKSLPVDFGPAIARRMPLRELLGHCAVLSLHCPLSDQTKGILDRQMLSLLRPGTIIINTARGAAG